MAKGVIDVGGLHYYMDPSTGRMAAGTTVDIGGVAYTADGSGVLSQVVQETGNETEGQPDRKCTDPGAGRKPGRTGTTAFTERREYLTRHRVWARLSPGSSGGPGVVVTPLGAVTAAAGFNVMDNKLNQGIILSEYNFNMM